MKWRAFTLIELLVVMGIITLIVAIVIPVLGLVRQYARTTRCGTNIRNIIISLIDYEVKNEAFPYSFFDTVYMKSPPGGQLGNGISDDVGWRWPNYIFGNSNGNLSNDPVLWCPSRRMEGNLFKYNMLVANYGVNQSICKSWVQYKNNEFYGSSLSVADIQSPQQVLLIVDSGYTMINWHHVTDSPPAPLGKSMADRSYLPGLKINKNRNLLPEQKDDAINGRHRNKTVNAGFVDGHVSLNKADDLFVEKTAEGYNNLTPLWLPRNK